jgi:hypothetical protein
VSGLGAVEAKEWFRLVRIQLEKVVEVREYFNYWWVGCFIREVVEVREYFNYWWVGCFIREAVHVEVTWVRFHVPIVLRFQSLRTHRLIMGVVNVSDLLGLGLDQAAGHSLGPYLQFKHF